MNLVRPAIALALLGVLLLHPLAHTLERHFHAPDGVAQTCPMCVSEAFACGGSVPVPVAAVQAAEEFLFLIPLLPNRPADQRGRSPPSTSYTLS